MARRKKDDSEGGIALLVIFILFILISVSPIFVLLFGLFYGLKFYWQYIKVNNDYSDFWLKSSEKQKYIQYYNQFTQYSTIIDDAHSLARTKNISINKDGSYSQRSNVGKQVQQAISRSQPYYQQAMHEVEYYQNLPYNRWLGFHTDGARCAAAVVSLIIWSISLSYLAYNHGINVKFLIQNYINFNFSSDGNFIFVVTGLASISSFFIAQWILIKVIKGKYSPQPPQVDIHNVNYY